MLAHPKRQSSRLKHYGKRQHRRQILEGKRRNRGEAVIIHQRASRYVDVCPGGNPRKLATFSSVSSSICRRNALLYPRGGVVRLSFGNIIPARLILSCATCCLDSTCATASGCRGVLRIPCKTSHSNTRIFSVWGLVASQGFHFAVLASFRVYFSKRQPLCRVYCVFQ